MAENIQRESPEIARRIVAIEAPRNQLSFLETTIGRLHFLTVDAPCDEAWDKVGDLVSSFDSIADVMRRALDSMDDDKYFTALKEEDGK